MSAFAKFAGAILSLVLVAPAVSHGLQAAAESPPALDLREHLESLRVDREEGWLAAQLRELRSFPHLDRAYELLEAGDLEGATEELEAYLAADPADHRVRYQLVSVLYRRGQWEDVVREASLILRSREAFLPALLYRGLALQHAGSPERAARDLEAVHRGAEKDSDLRRFALVQHVDLELATENWQAAERLARALIEVEGEGASSHLRLGRALEGLGRWREAASAYAAAGQAAGTPATKLRALELRGFAAQRAGDYEEAAAAFRGALELEPRGTRLLRSLAAIESERGRHSEAASLARRAHESEEGAPRDLEILAQALLADGRPGEAVGPYRRLLEGGGSPETRYRWWMALGGALTASGDAPGAATAFESARALRPGTESSAAVGEARAAQGDWTGAIAAYREALEEDPSAERRHRLGMALARGGRPEEALNELQRALEEGLAGPSRAQALSQLGYLHESAGRYDAALEAFRESLEAGGDPASLERALATTLVALERYEEAETYLRRVLARGPDREIRRQLAMVRAARGDVTGAINLYLDLLAERPDPSVDLLATIANLEFERGNMRAAAEFYRRALERSEAPSPALALRAVESLVAAEAWEEADDLLDRSLDLETDDETRRRLWRLEASTETRLGHWDEAAHALRRLMELGEYGEEILVELGLVEFRRERFQEARDAFLEIPVEQRAPRSHLYLGRVYEALGRPGLAVHHYEHVMSSVRELELGERIEALRGLGYLYFAEHEYAAAADAWSRAEVIESDPEIRVRLASAHRRVGGRDDLARDLLESTLPEDLSIGVRVLRLRELAALDRAAGDLDSAARSLRLASELGDDAEISYELSQVYRDQGHTEEEILVLERAASLDPEEARYFEALGYAYARADRDRDAIDAFEKTLALDRDVLPVSEDLGYLYRREAENAEAITSFERAIDNRPYYPMRSEENREELERTMRRLRAEATALDDSWDVSAYLAVRSEELPATTSASFTGGVLPSQGGIEIAWAPPTIGRRNGRVFQIFGRVLGNLEPESVEPISETYQGGLGLRYKPLQRQNVVLSAERLFEIGERSIEDWLLRGQFSTNFGEVLDPARRRWNHTTLYLDAGYFVDAEVAAYYGEFRQGVTIRAGRRALLTPHVVADGRYQDPDTAFSSYFEYGAGASISFLIAPERRYRVERGVFELLVHYKLGEFVDVGPDLTDETFDGWVVTGILRF